MNASATNKPSETNWDKVDALDDSTIDTSDIPPLPESFFARATLRVPPSPIAVTLNVDSDVIGWFKAQGDTWEPANTVRVIQVARAHSQGARYKSSNTPRVSNPRSRRDQSRYQTTLSG